MSERRIRLTPAYSPRIVDESIQGARVVITASQGNLIPDAIFAYRQAPLVVGTDQLQAIFSHVCSPVDLEEFPEAAPLPEADPPWFRLASVDLVYRSRIQAEQGAATIFGEVATLIRSLDTLDELEAYAPVWIGTPPEEDP